MKTKIKKKMKRKIKDKVIKLKLTTIKEIERYREHPRETWDDIVNKIIDKCRRKNNG